MDTLLYIAVLALAATAQASVIGGLKGTWYGSCETPVVVKVNDPVNKCIPPGNIINQAYNVTFNADETWNWTLGTQQIEIDGRSYKAGGFGVPRSPLMYHQAMDNGFCADAGDGYVTITRSIIKMASGGTLVMYGEVGYVDYTTNMQTKAFGCPPASMAATCSAAENYYTYRCSAIRVM